MKSKLLLFLTISVIGCSRTEPVPQQVTEALTFSISADMPATKTALEENGGTYALTWNSGDKIGLYIGGRQQNCRMKFSDGLFSGSLEPGKGSSESAGYMAYWPYTSTSDGNVVSGEIAEIQYAPFDGSSDFMYTDVVNAVYDESNMPSDVKLTFAHHIFGVVEVNVVNEDETLADEKILSVTLSSETATLGGAYCFDLSTKSAPAFDADRSRKTVTAEFRDPETLGKGAVHKFHLVVNPFENLNDLKLTVKTSSYTFSKEAGASVSLSAGKVTVFPEVALTESGAVKRKKVLSYFGDSIANNYMKNYLKALLGDGWDVYMNGIPGASDQHVAALLGCIGMTFQDSFTLPASRDEKVECGKICAVENINGQKGMFDVLSSYWFNDGLLGKEITIYVYTDEDAAGIECKLTCDFKTDDRPNAKYYLNRVHSAAAATEIAAGKSVVKTYQAMHLRDADVLCIYTGTNNNFSESDYPSVVEIHKRMRDFMTGPAKEDYIICGFHTNRYVGKHIMWTKAYADGLDAAFGKHVLDYKLLGLDIDTGHVPVPSGYSADVTFSNTGSMTDAEKNGYHDKALALSKTVGAVTGDDFNEADKANVSVLEWPASWWGDYATNVHPNAKGYDVMAHLVYEKMKSLGYLD